KIHDVRARGSHALAFVSPGTIEIVGNLDLSGDSGVSGPGAAACSPGAGGAGGTTPSAPFGHWAVGFAGEPVGPNGHVYRTSGAGGGGFATGGAPGGADGVEEVGPAGATYNVPLLVPLRGGCDGGSFVPVHRGGAGGALQLVSNDSVMVSAGASGTGVI